MKKSQRTSMAVAVALTSTFAWSLAHADKIGGGPRADFRDDKLTVPCVNVDHLSPAIDENYYDIVLDRRGKSYNYELITALPEDTALCERLAAIAAFEDEDYSDGVPAPGANGFGILVRCDLTAGRSKVSVDAKNLAAGTYVASIRSGLNTRVSSPRIISGDEIEFDFDSNANSVADGAFQINADFIQNDLKVSAEIINHVTNSVVYSATANCLLD